MLLSWERLWMNNVIFLVNISRTCLRRLKLQVRIRDEWWSTFLHARSHYWAWLDVRMVDNFCDMFSKKQTVVCLFLRKVHYALAGMNFFFCTVKLLRWVKILKNWSKLAPVLDGVVIDTEKNELFRSKNKTFMYLQVPEARYKIYQNFPRAKSTELNVQNICKDPIWRRRKRSNALTTIMFLKILVTTQYLSAVYLVILFSSSLKQCLIKKKLYSFENQAIFCL